MEEDLGHLNLTWDYNQSIANFNDMNPFNKLHIRIIFIICYSVVFALCFIGNCMVLFAIARSPRLRSMTNFFLANLAVADLCVGTFCVLPNLSTFLYNQTWILGKAMCKIYYFVWNLSYMTSIIILTVIAAERYIVIRYPLRAKQRLTTARMKLVQALIWIISAGYNIPYLVMFDTITIEGIDEEFCFYKNVDKEHLKILTLTNFIILYLIPLILMAYMYGRIAATLWKTSSMDEVRLHRCSKYSGSLRTNLTKAPPDDSDTMNTYPENRPKRAYSTDKDTNGECPHKKSDSSNCSDEYSSEKNSGSRSSDNYVACFGRRKPSIALNHRADVDPTSRRDSAPESPFLNENQRSQNGIFKFSVYINNPKKSIQRESHMTSSRRIDQARRKIIRLLVVVVASFAVCVLPHHIRALMLQWGIVLPQGAHMLLAPISFVVLYMNSAVNPMIYALLSRNFRRSFKESWACLRFKCTCGTSTEL